MESVIDKIKIEKYPAYKQSGVEWIGEIPKHWKANALGALLELKSDKNHPEFEVLSVYRDYGVIIKDSRDDNHNTTSLDTSNYKAVEPGDLVVNKMKAWQGSMGISAYKGIVSPAYIVCKVNSTQVIFKYLHQLLRCNSYTSEYNRISYGIRVGQWDMHYEDFKRVLVVLPPLYEQTAIANFLDNKTSLIDKAIGIKEKQIALLKEHRQILIHHAVTRGLDPNVKLKDSGVEWIGEIPEHWEIKRLKDVSLINLNSLPEITNCNFTFRYVDIGSVTLESGITQTEEFIFKNAPSRARRIAQKGDTIISTVRTYLKATDYIDEEKSNYIYSTGFAILKPKEIIQPEFLAYFVRSDAFTEQVTENSKGMSYPAINSTDLGILRLVHGKIDEQKEIVSYIEINCSKITTAISLKEKEIEKLKEYKSTLINSAVTGKIKVS